MAAAPWHGPAAQRLWMPLLEAPVPLPRRERDPGKMHPKDTQKKNTHLQTEWFSFEIKHYSQHMPAAFQLFSMHPETHTHTHTAETAKTH